MGREQSEPPSEREGDHEVVEGVAIQEISRSFQDECSIKMHAHSFSRLRRQLPRGGSLWMCADIAFLSVERGIPHSIVGDDAKEASHLGRGGGVADGEGSLTALSPAIAGALPKGEPSVRAKAGGNTLPYGEKIIRREQAPLHNARQRH